MAKMNEWEHRENKKYPCPECYYPMTACSKENTCLMLAERKRQIRQVRLQQITGMTAKQIAEAVGLSTAVVKAWIGGGSNKKISEFIDRAQRGNAA